MDFIQLTEVFGNVGEFVGSFAVLATLVYVAMQVNHSKSLLEKQGEAIELSNKIAISTAESELFYRNVDWYKALVENQHVAELVVKLSKSEELNEVESAQVIAMTSQLFQLWISSESYHKNGLIDDEIYESMLRAPEYVMNMWPGMVPFIGRMAKRGSANESRRNHDLMERITASLQTHGYVGDD